MTAHVPYFNDRLQADYCTHCGDEWPCLPWREDNPRCLCSHAKANHRYGYGNCWMAACGCRAHRTGQATPERFRDEYDPSPDPIDRRTA